MQPGELRSFGQRLRALRLGQALSQAELARRIGRHQTAIGPYERDEYMPSRDVVEKLAAALASSPEYLQFGRTPHRSSLQRLGRLDGSGQLGTAGQSPTLALAEERLIAVVLEDDAMLPVFRPGQTLLVGRLPSTDWHGLCGRHALVELACGRLFLRRIMPAAAPDQVVLTAYQAPPIGPVSPVAARVVLGVLENDALLAERQEQSP